jgi:uncharacterized secreted protein with C-terminal beta-propeller domain
MTGHRGHVRTGLSLFAGLVLLAGCTHARPTADLQTLPTLRLVAFDSCDDLLAGLRAAAKESVGPYGFGGAVNMTVDTMEKGAIADAPNSARSLNSVPQAATPAHSSTNTNEIGVDEPDLVKTDGKRIVTVGDGSLRVIDAAARKITGTLALEPNTVGENLLLAGDHALVLTRSVAVPFGSIADSYPAPSPAPSMQARLLLVDLAGTPRIVSRYTMDGYLVDARQVGTVARVVIHSSPTLPFRVDRDVPNEQRLAGNRRVIDEAPIDQWLPSYTVESGDRQTTGRVDCRSVSRPTAYSGSSMLTVLTFDVAAPALGNGNPASLVADGDTVYSNGPSLYIASDNRWRAWPMLRLARPTAVEGQTELYKFDISGPGKPKYVAGGNVPGWLINQYALSEWGGKLRVAATSNQPWDQTSKSESTVYVLDEALHGIGRVGGLGKGERIYAVRFVGPTGYVVTFRQTDPLYVLDLRNPGSPRVTGELKINGYSSYLYPAGNGRLIGVGRSADDNGRTNGMQVSLFDVADPTRPTRIAQYALPGSYSEAESDPHAFLYWQPTGLLVVPVWQAMLRTNVAPSSGAVALRLAGTSINSAGSIAGPPDQQIRRSLMIGDVLWTVSDRSVAAYDAGTLAKLAQL